MNALEKIFGVDDTCTVFSVFEFLIEHPKTPFSVTDLQMATYRGNSLVKSCVDFMVEKNYLKQIGNEPYPNSKYALNNDNLLVSLVKDFVKNSKYAISKLEREKREQILSERTPYDGDVLDVLAIHQELMYRENSRCNFELEEEDDEDNERNC